MAAYYPRNCLLQCAQDGALIFNWWKQRVRSGLAARGTEPRAYGSRTHQTWPNRDRQRRCERRQLVALQSTSFSVAMPHDPRTEWVGPIPTDPLEHVCEYKLGFDDVSDVQAKNCIITHDERKQLSVVDAQTLAQAMIDQGPTEIEYLFLAGNVFGDEGLFAFAKAMEEGSCQSC